MAAGHSDTRPAVPVLITGRPSSPGLSTVILFVALVGCDYRRNSSAIYTATGSWTFYQNDGTRSADPKFKEFSKFFQRGDFRWPQVAVADCGTVDLNGPASLSFFAQ